MSLSILDGRRNFWQWDTDQQLLVEDTACGMVHYCNGTSECALVSTIKTLEDGRRVAAVPNILLQSPDMITAYLYQVDEYGARTRKDYRFRVLPRSRPADYVYTENDVYAYLDLEKRITDLERGGVSDERIEQVVTEYLEEHPVQSGATKEEAEQITKNKANIETLTKDKLDASKLPEAVDDALAKAKQTGLFDGEDYVLTPSDKEEIAALAADMVEVPAPDSGGNVELDTSLTQSGKAADAKAVGDKIAEITGISLIEPAEDDIPKIFFGGALQQTKDEKVVPFRYISKTEEIIGFAEIKAQGNSSMSYPKKNQTVKMFKDADCTEKLKVDFKGWGKQNKHVYKANWIDLTHARNVVSARLWGDVLRSRADYESLPELLRTSPNQGAVDGFPVKVYANGIYQGRYTINIPKDAWMANMDKDLDTHCILCGENYVSGCFRASANINESDWTDEIHDTVPASIKTRWNQVISFVMNSTDDEFRANLNQYFYIDSLIDYYLFGLASCGLDAFGKNQLYMTYDGQKWIATMYDMDSTWGLWWNGSSFVATDYDRSEYQDFKDGEGNLLYIRLENLFHEELKARWAELRSGALSIENIINRFERFTDIAPAELVNEDYASTTGDGKFTGIPSKTTSTIQQIRSYAVARHAWCDTYVAALAGGGEVEPDEPDVPETVPCTGITLSASTLTFTEAGSQTLVATVEPTDTTDSVEWSVSPVGIVTVSNGVVTPLTRGSCVITATCGEQSATCSVAVDIDVTTWMENADIDRETGEVIAGDSYISSFIPVETNHRYQFTNPTNGNFGRVAGYTEDGVLVKYYGEVTATGILAFDAIGGVKKVRLGVYGSSADLNGAVNNLVNLGIWSGGGYEIDSTTGEIVASQYNTNRVTMEKIPVEAGATYRISNINSGAAKYMLFSEYDANGEFIRASAESGNNTNPFEQTMTTNTAFIMAKVSSAKEVNGNIEISKV